MIVMVFLNDDEAQQTLMFCCEMCFEVLVP